MTFNKIIKYSPVGTVKKKTKVKRQKMTPKEANQILVMMMKWWGDLGHQSGKVKWQLRWKVTSATSPRPTCYQSSLIFDFHINWSDKRWNARAKTCCCEEDFVSKWRGAKDDENFDSSIYTMWVCDRITQVGIVDEIEHQNFSGPGNFGDQVTVTLMVNLNLNLGELYRLANTCIFMCQLLRSSFLEVWWFCPYAIF